MKNLLRSCIILLILHQISSQTVLPPESEYVEPNECELGNGKVIGCTDDCKGQKFCMNDQVFLIDCHQQTGRSYCSPKTLECVSVSAGCDLPDRDFICPGSGYFPHPFNCSKFYDCKTSQIARLVQCTNSVFDPLEEKCKLSLPCYTFSAQNGLCRGKLNAIVVHPLNKRLYVLCTEKPLMGQCPQDLVFNTGKLQCEFLCKARGIFKDSENSNCYYECSSLLKPIHGCCGDGYIYNDDFKTCMPL